MSFLLFFFYDLRRLHVVLSFSYFEGRKNLFGARDVCNDFLSNNGNPACDTSAMANTVRMLRTIDYDAVNGLKVSQCNEFCQRGSNPLFKTIGLY